jgi:hypothetical protein
MLQLITFLDASFIQSYIIFVLITNNQELIFASINVSEVGSRFAYELVPRSLFLFQLELNEPYPTVCSDFL